MSFIEKYLDQFVHLKDKENPEKFRKGRFFIASIFIFIVFGIPGVLYNFLFQSQMLVQNITILGIIFFMCSLFFLYQRFNKRIWFVNLLILAMFSSNYGIYSTTGGIYSSDNAWLILLWCLAFLMANKLSGLIWLGISLIFYTFLLYADLTELKNFKTDLLLIDGVYAYINYFFAAITIAIIIFLHESGKEKYLNEMMAAKAESEEKSKELEAQKKDIISSINYAKRIQNAVQPREEIIYQNIPHAFIFYKPRDIVSGDFFWFHEIDKDNYILVCADCTGHGVPGAFMTVIGSSSLNQIVLENKVTKPADILLELDKKIVATLQQEKSKTNDSVQDGMDLSLLKVNKQRNELIFTSAKRPAIFIRSGKVTEWVGSKNSLGGLQKENKKFEEISISYLEGDAIYLFTDGYPDQFGGEQHRKFMIKRFRELLAQIYRLPVEEQKRRLESEIMTWMGTGKQTDDITVIGIRF